MNDVIKKLLRESLNEIANDEIWYHGTPDVTKLEREGGFTHKTMKVQYVTDLKKYYEVQNNLKLAREEMDEAKYFKYLDMVAQYRDDFEFRKPIFLTNDEAVARTYADHRRAFDYQNAWEKVLKIKMSNVGKIITIVAKGDRFRFINSNKVKKGFMNAGINERDFDETFNKFTFYQKSKDGIRTDMIAAIGEWFGADIIDVDGVLDSYNGGSIESTVRMVYDVKLLTII